MCTLPPPPAWFLWPWDAPLVWLASAVISAAIGVLVYVLRRTRRRPRIMYSTWLYVRLFSYPLWALLFAEGIALINTAQVWSQQAFVIAGQPQCDPSLSTSAFNEWMTHFIDGFALLFAALVGIMCMTVVHIILMILRLAKRREAAWG